METPSSNARDASEEKRNDHVEPELLCCAFCGGAVPDTAEENVAHGKKGRRALGKGCGLCRSCGGDPVAKTPEARLGCALSVFTKARVPVLAARLSSAARARFLAMPLDKQGYIILELLKRRALKW